MENKLHEVITFRLEGGITLVIPKGTPYHTFAWPTPHQGRDGDSLRADFEEAITYMEAIARDVIGRSNG